MLLTINSKKRIPLLFIVKMMENCDNWGIFAPIIPHWIPLSIHNKSAYILSIRMANPKVRN